MANYASKIILFNSKSVERYPYSSLKMNGQKEDSREVMTRVVHEALTSKNIDFKYARAKVFASMSDGNTYYNIEYWD